MFKLEDEQSMGWSAVRYDEFKNKIKFWFIDGTRYQSMEKAIIERDGLEFLIARRTAVGLISARN